jgi:TMEM175 potassium channel family protein
MQETNLGRIVAFTDGVFAVAVTLLVFTMDVPAGDHEITRRVLEQWPDLLAYFLSFAVVGRLWLAHHRFFATLHRFDPWLLRLNLMFLSLVVLIPFTTELLSDHGGDAVAPIVYATVIGAAVTVNWLMVRHTLFRRHVRDEDRAQAEPFGHRGALVTPVVFFASIPVALLSPTAAEAMWALLLLQRPARRVQRTRSGSDATSS